MGEQAFEYRLSKILKEKGYLIINSARSKPFDIIAVKEGTVFFIELKGKNTRLTIDQFMRQKRMSQQYRLNYAVIRQSKKQGKIEAESYCDGAPVWGTMLEADLKELTVHPT